MHDCGGLAQLGERLAGSQKVRGSSPLSSTQTHRQAYPGLHTLVWFFSDGDAPPDADATAAGHC
jgi:hypothetical protein